MELLDLSFKYKEKIREINFQNLKIGADRALSFMSENDNITKPLFAIEFLYSSKTLFDDLKNENLADIISIKFDIDEDSYEQEIENIKIFLKELENITTKPLILRGANNTIDKRLMPILAQNAPTESIIAFAQEESYEDIVPPVIENNHILVLRTPIDINIAKELNILSIDKGLRPDRILIDPDMGALGYGLDYGYSIIEKIRQAAFDGDKMLNMPIIAFIGEESDRAKEAKSNTLSGQWGNFEERSAMWEISAATALISAGANILVLRNPKSVETLKGLY